MNFVNKCRAVYFLRKVSMFSGKLRTRKSAQYKPPGSLIEAIAAGRLLLLSPWPHYVPNKSRCTRAECTAMNAMAEAIANAAAERGSQGGQSDGDSIGSYPVLPTNNTRIAAKCCDITISKRQHRILRKQRSGILSEYKRQQLILLPIRSASSGVLFVGC